MGITTVKPKNIINKNRLFTEPVFMPVFEENDWAKMLVPGAKKKNQIQRSG